MGHYGKLIKNENKDFLKNFIVNDRKYISIKDYQKLKDDGKLEIKFPDFYYLEYDPIKFLNEKNYEQFMLEVFNQYITQHIDKLKDLFYIECHVIENDFDENNEKLYVTAVFDDGKNIYMNRDNINYKNYIYFDDENYRFYLHDSVENNRELESLCKKFNNLINSESEVYLWIKY